MAKEAENSTKYASTAEIIATPAKAVIIHSAALIPNFTGMV